MMIAERVRTDLHASRIPVGEGHLCRWAQAMTDYGAGSQAGPVLSRLDFGLMRAESAGNDQVVILGATDTQSPSEAGEQAWKQAIQSALEENRYELATEALTSANGSLVRTEAMLMLRTAADQMPIPATLFIPPAVRLDLVADCDLQAVALGLQWLAANEGELAVRVALPSLRGQKFFRRLALLLTEKRPLAPGCSWKSMLTAWSNATSRSPRWRGWCRNLARISACAGWRSNSARWRSSLPLSYVKLGGGFVGGMSQKPGQPAADGLGTADGARPEHRGVCGRRARRGNPAHPGRPGHQRDARSRRQAAGPAGLKKGHRRRLRGIERARADGIPRWPRAFGLLVQRQDLLRRHLQIADARGGRWMGGQELGRRLATVRRAHLLPQRDGGARIVAGARGQLHAHAVGLGFMGAAVGQREHHAGQLAAQVAGLLGPRGDGQHRQPQIGHHLLRHALARMFAQGVGNLMAQHGGQLVIGGLDLVQQSRVDGDLAARHAPGVDLVAGQHVHFPFPARRIGPEYAGLRDQPLRDRAGARHLRGIAVQQVPGLGLLQDVAVLLAGLLLQRLGRHHAGHVLRAVDADGARLRGVHARATRQHGKTKAAPGRAWQENPTHEDLRSAIMAAGRQAYQTETSAHCAR